MIEYTAFFFEEELMRNQKINIKSAQIVLILLRRFLIQIRIGINQIQ